MKNMRAQGNGNPILCATNLLRITRGEVPNDRIRGLDAKHFDRPISIVSDDLRNDARWLLNTYEPRVNADEIEITLQTPELGQLGLAVELSRREG